MSDNIKADYKKYAENVQPSEEFLSRLTVTLEKEQAKQKSRNIMRFVPIASAAACLVLAVGIGAVAIGRTQNSPLTSNPDDTVISSDVTPQFGTNSTISENSKPFVNVSWYEGDAAEGLNVILAQKLTSELDYLSYNTENKFVDCERADEAAVSDISQKLLSGKPSSESPEGDTVYYMAVFKDGKVAKFSITGGRLAVIAGDDTVYEIF